MMLGERTHHLNPTVQVPPCPMYDDLPPTSPYHLGDEAFSALWRFLPSNDVYTSDDDESESAVDAYSCDEFRIYEFKVRRCSLGRPHDWTECPYAHPGEKARRRDPRKYHYSGTACPDFRKGNCMRGDSCEFAHGVFECWLHPARYRTQPCKDGVYCRRRVCFFAHTPEQLRLHPNQTSRASTGCVGNGDFSPVSCRSSAIADSYDGSPLRQQHQYNLPSLVSDGYLLSNTQMSSSPTSTLISPLKSPLSESPPFSPFHGGSSVNELLLSLRQLQLNKAAAAAAAAKSSIGTGGSWGMPQLISPRGLTYAVGGRGVGVVPTAAMRLSPICDGGLFDGWEEPVERVESGRDLRAMMVKKLSKENSLECTNDGDASGSGGVALDVDWISDLVE